MADQLKKLELSTLNGTIWIENTALRDIIKEHIEKYYPVEVESVTIHNSDTAVLIKIKPIKEWNTRPTNTISNTDIDIS